MVLWAMVVNDCLSDSLSSPIHSVQCSIHKDINVFVRLYSCTEPLFIVHDVLHVYATISCLERSCDRIAVKVHWLVESICLLRGLYTAWKISAECLLNHALESAFPNSWAETKQRSAFNQLECSFSAAWPHLLAWWRLLTDYGNTWAG